MNQESTTGAGLTDALGLDEDLESLAGKARESIEAFVQERPHVALGVAAAAGFVLGGGLTPRRLFKLAVSAGGPLLSRQLRSQALRILSDAMDNAGAKSGVDATQDAPASGDDAKPKRPRRPRAVSET